MKKFARISIILISTLLCYFSIADKLTALETEADRISVFVDLSDETSSNWTDKESPYVPVAELGGIANHTSQSVVSRIQRINSVKYLSTIKSTTHLLAGYDSILSHQATRESDMVTHHYSLTPGDYYVITLRRLLI